MDTFNSITYLPSSIGSNIKGSAIFGQTQPANFSKNTLIFQTLDTDAFKNKSDCNKIITFNKLKNDVYGGNEDDRYAIVDKKKCTLTVYNMNGDVIKKYTVGLGSKRGDKLGYGSALPKSDPKYREGQYTTPGEFTLDQVSPKRRTEKSLDLYGERIIYLKGDNKGENSTQEAIHQTSGEYGRDRLDNDSQGILSDNRFSSGCVVMLPEQYDDLMKHIGEGDKVYILPEEKGNELILENTNDELKFVQKYHKDQKRDMTAEEASEVVYDYAPQKAPSLGSKLKGLFYSIFKWL